MSFKQADRNIAVIIVILILLACAGCSSKKAKEPSETSYYKGNEGLAINFVENIPAKEIKQRSSFVLVMELKNKGAFNIENGLITITGYDPNMTNIGDSNIKSNRDPGYFEIPDISLKGKGDEFPEGEYKLLTVNGLMKELKRGKTDDPGSASFRVVAQYPYKTTAVIPVCISADSYGYIKPKQAICEIKDINIADGQGGPVAVTKISTTPIIEGENMKLGFTITISNKGNGNIAARDNVLVDITNKKLRKDIDLTCDYEGVKNKITKEVLGETKDFSIYCETDTAIPKPLTPYISTLSLDLDYIYNSKIEKQIKVIR